MHGPTAVVLNLRSRPKSGSRWVCRRVARRFYEEIYFGKKKNLCLNSNNNLENVITESVFINFKLTGAIKF
jgi:hypothetical protein